MAHQVPLADWEYDPAHQACTRWIEAWRREHPDDDRPPLSFAQHLGGCAVALADGTDRTDLVRVFTAAGYDGACPCGQRPDQPIVQAAA